jgi:hypothetical protein
MVEVPVPFLKRVAAFKLSPVADRRLQQLMDGNTEGRLSRGERAELRALVDLSERFSLLRAEAFAALTTSSA